MPSHSMSEWPRSGGWKIQAARPAFACLTRASATSIDCISRLIADGSPGPGRRAIRAASPRQPATEYPNGARGLRSVGGVTSTASTRPTPGRSWARSIGRTQVCLVQQEPVLPLLRGQPAGERRLLLAAERSGRGAVAAEDAVADGGGHGEHLPVARE